MNKFFIGVLCVTMGFGDAYAEKLSAVDTLKSEKLDEVYVMASYSANKFNEPVVLTNVSREQLTAKISNNDFPGALKSVPSAYFSTCGGAFGDSRITLRGFGSENIALLVNGIPMNGMENNSIYWSNWAGLAEVSSNVQVARGIGLSKLGLYSVGGTINIITTKATQDAGGWLYYGIGNDGYQKMSVSFSTGESKKGFSLSVLGSRSSGNGFVNATNFESWDYYISLAKKIGANHKLTFTAFGAPQWHNRRSNKQSIEDYKSNRDGIRMNTTYGYINGELVPTYSGFNKYHQPLISLNHYWTINSRSSLSTALYASWAKGGGKKVYGSDANRLQYNYKTGKPNPTTDLTPDGLIDYAPVMSSNAASDHGSDAIFTMGSNDHDLYGGISTYTYNYDNGLSLSAGLDIRYYKAYRYDEITDLLGGAYYKDATLAWRDPALELHVGDKVNQDFISEVMWTGGFAQLAYNKGAYDAFLSATVSENMFRRNDPGKYGEFGNQTTFPKEDRKSDWAKFTPFGIKGGFNYKITPTHRVFINGGYVTKAPVADNTYFNNNIIENAEVEKITTVEFGYNFLKDNLDIQINAYYTKWADKSVVKSIGSWNGPKAAIPGLDAVHKGVEVDVAYSPLESLKLNGFFSLGDWRWNNDVHFSYYDDNNSLIGEYNAYVKDVHVGNAPQTSLMLGAVWMPSPNISLGINYNQYWRLYADFTAIDRTAADDTSDSWKLPAYGTVDLNASYKVPVGKFNFQIYANVNNLFNREYICEAADGTEHDSKSSYVWYGLGTTWTTGLRLVF